MWALKYFSHARGECASSICTPLLPCHQVLHSNLPMYTEFQPFQWHHVSVEQDILLYMGHVPFKKKGKAPLCSPLCQVLVYQVFLKR